MRWVRTRQRLQRFEADDIDLPLFTDRYLAERYLVTPEELEAGYLEERGLCVYHREWAPLARLGDGNYLVSTRTRVGYDSEPYLRLEAV